MSLVKAVFTLTAFSAADRALGFLFKIYLSREMGAAALGTYQIALSLLFALSALMTSGLPLITGKKTAGLLAEGKTREAGSVVGAGLVINCSLALLLACVVLALSPVLPALMSGEEAAFLLLLMLPALLFGGAQAAFRGNLWGREKFFAVSGIELLEQVFRITICVALFTAGMGKTTAAVVSLVAAMLLSTAITIAVFVCGGGRVHKPGGQLKSLIAESAPISALRASTSLTGVLMAAITPFLFASTGYTHEESLALYGACAGMAMPLLYLPITVIGSLSYALIPELGKAAALGRADEVKARTETSVKFSVIVSAACMPMFWGVGREVGELIYGDAVAGETIRQGTFLIIPIALESITSSMMNSLGMEKQGFFNYIIGTAATIGVMFCFYGNFTINAVVLAMFVGLTLSTVLDIFCIKKHTGISLGFFRTIFGTCMLAVPCALLAEWTVRLTGGMPSAVGIAAGAAAGTAAILLLMWAFGFYEGFTVFRKRKKAASTRIKHLPTSG